MVSDILSGLLADGQYSRGTGVQGFSVITTEPAPTKKCINKRPLPCELRREAWEGDQLLRLAGNL